jgi:membrane protease YdiL (CAAX protease family)
MTAVNRTWIILCCLAAPEAIPLALMTARNGIGFMHYLGFGHRFYGAPLGWALALAFAALYVGMATSRFTLIRKNFFHLNVMKVLVLLVFAPITGSFEELYFRKVLMNTVAAHGRQSCSRLWRQLSCSVSDTASGASSERACGSR